MKKNAREAIFYKIKDGFEYKLSKRIAIEKLKIWAKLL